MDLAGLPVAIYARFSTSNQREASIEDQVRRCRQYVERAGGRVCDEFIFPDMAISGASLARPGFERMMEFAERTPRPFVAIVTEDLSRISRDLHDGILQTLLSLNIQLEVLRIKAEQKPEQVGADITGLQKTVRQEGEELRRMVTDMRPLRVDSADMRELMHGFAERFRNESGLKLDLFINDQNMRVPDRLCRELFQIYREALHNIKKHAKASHVVVKLGQDDTRVFLVIDDNGTGFSFSGHYASEDLDRLRLGPISIKERARSVGGTLTVESNPGHGARLTIEIPIH